MNKITLLTLTKTRTFESMKLSHIRHSVSVLAAGAVLLLGYSSSKAQLIGVQTYATAFPADSVALTASQMAGFLPQEYFNTIGAGSGGPLSLVDSANHPTGITFTLVGGDDYKTGSGISTPNDTLLSGQSGSYNITPATYTFNNVAAGSYNLIVYTVTNNDGQLAEVNLSTGTTSGPATYFDTEQNGANFNGSFVLGSATTSGSATLANYVEFSGITPVGGVFAISVPLSNSGAVGISGFQLQEIPEPSTYAMMLAGIAVLGFFVRRKAGRFQS